MNRIQARSAMKQTKTQTGPRLSLAAGVHTALGLALTAMLILPNAALAGDRHWEGGSSDIVTNGNGAGNGGAGTWNSALLDWDQGNGPAPSWPDCRQEPAMSK